MKLHCQGRTAVAGREEACDGHADLHRGQKSARVLPETGHHASPLTFLGQPADLPLSQRDQSDLRCREVTADQDEKQHYERISKPTIHTTTVALPAANPLSVSSQSFSREIANLPAWRTTQIGCHQTPRRC